MHYQFSAAVWTLSGLVCSCDSRVVYSLFSYHQKNLGGPGSSKGKLERIRAGLTVYTGSPYVALTTASSITIRAANYISFKWCFLFIDCEVGVCLLLCNCITKINSLGNSFYLPFYFLFRYLKPPLVSISYSFQISQQTYSRWLNIFLACIQNRANVGKVSKWTQNTFLSRF
jgi:hypothetical protein